MIADEPNDAPRYQWDCVTMNAAFAPRDGAGALVYKDRMWLLGGWNPGDKANFPKICNSEVWSSTDGAVWDLVIRRAPWEGRHTAGYAVHRGRMWIVGGDCNQGYYHTDIWSSEDGVHWDCVNAHAPWPARALHHTVAYRDALWVMGGQTVPGFAGPEPEAFYNDVWHSEDGANWERVTEHCPWTPRGMIGFSAVFQDRIWLLGGGTYDTPTTPTRKFFNEVWSTRDGIEWERHPDAPWAPREYHDVAVFDGRMWVMEGGTDAGNRKDVWHSADGVTWHELPGTPWKPRHAASVFVYDGGLWMVAGNNMESDAWKLTRA